MLQQNKDKTVPGVSFYRLGRPAWLANVRFLSTGWVSFSLDEPFKSSRLRMVAFNYGCKVISIFGGRKNKRNHNPVFRFFSQ